MAFVLEFDEKAEIEFHEAYDWYEEQLAGLGKRFQDALEKAYSSISEMPLIYPVKKSRYRECVVNDFPFVVAYKIYSTRNTVYIVSIFHTSRNPTKKYKK